MACQRAASLAMLRCVRCLVSLRLGQELSPPRGHQGLEHCPKVEAPHRRLQACSAAPDEQAAGLSGEVCSQRCSLYDVPGRLAEEVADALLGCGAQSAAVEEFRPPGAPEQEIFAGGVDAAGRVWERCTVVAHFPPEADAAEAVLEVQAGWGLHGGRWSAEPVTAADWEQGIRVGLGAAALPPGAAAAGGLAAWRWAARVADAATLARVHAASRDSYTPLEVAPGLWIVPVWSTPPDPAAVSIRLEPGLAFGTGDHPTTRLCLRWLRALQLEGARVMDYGTGSGVLAIGALLFGAADAVGTDIEPLAVRAAASNADLNGLGTRFAARLCAPVGDQPPWTAAAAAAAAAGGGSAEGQGAEAGGGWEVAGGYDVVVANILQGPLTALAPQLAALAAPGGALGLSGILAEQVPAIREAYAPYFEGFATEQEGGWALLTATRRRA